MFEDVIYVVSNLCKEVIRLRVLAQMYLASLRGHNMRKCAQQGGPRRMRGREDTRLIISRKVPCLGKTRLLREMHLNTEHLRRWALYLPLTQENCNKPFLKVDQHAAHDISQILLFTLSCIGRLSTEQRNNMQCYKCMASRCGLISCFLHFLSECSGTDAAIVNSLVESRGSSNHRKSPKIFLHHNTTPFSQCCKCSL